jgi:hypothetical protein
MKNENIYVMLQQINARCRKVADYCHEDVFAYVKDVSLITGVSEDVLYGICGGLLSELLEKHKIILVKHDKKTS